MSHKKNSKIEKLSLAVLFGGRSAEHEISIITALQAIQAMDPDKYNVIPVYITPTGKWFAGKGLLNKSIYKTFDENHPDITEVTLLPKPNINALILCKNGIPTDARIPIDTCFLAFHGQQGEDGCIQGLLELADIPYTGCNVTTSALTMHKHFCKAVVTAHGVPTLPGACIAKEDAIKDLDASCKKIQSTPGLENFPLFVKPCRLGSSIGISPAYDKESLHGALAKAFQYDDVVLVEPLIEKPMEINIAVMDGEAVTASVVEIPQSACAMGMLTYEDKYMRGGNKKAGQPQQGQGMASLPRIIDPKHLPQSVKDQIAKYALDAYSALDCSGVARLDFIVDTKSDKIYFNELNPIPGSLAFYLWEHGPSPLLYTYVIDAMILQANKRKSRKLSLQSHIGFKALT